jgi:2-C-methyl-D-erythritol 4-phosphate cytidylyltransferase
MRIAAIIAASGTGIRMNETEPKQFLTLEGVPILARTMGVFQRSPLITSILPVVPPGYIQRTEEEIIKAHKIMKSLPPVTGGSRRQDSVKLGFLALPPVDMVVIHDGVRPLINEDLISRCLEAARESGASLCAVQPVETVKTSDDARRVRGTLDRRTIWLAQTPQAFKHQVLQTAYDTIPSEKTFTDEAALVEAAGFPVVLVPGPAGNIKITSPEDMILSRAILSISMERGSGSTEGAH